MFHSGTHVLVELERQVPFPRPEKTIFLSLSLPAGPVKKMTKQLREHAQFQFGQVSAGKWQGWQIREIIENDGRAINLGNIAILTRKKTVYNNVDHFEFETVGGGKECIC